MNKILFFALLFFVYPNLGYTKSQSTVIEDRYAFKSPEQEVKFTALLKDIRCLVCQNQDLNDSNSTFSENLREQIHQWILEGKSQEEIVHILTGRYGDFILFNPPVQKNTYILWIGPFFLFIFAISGLVFLVLRRSRTKKNTAH